MMLQDSVSVQFGSFAADLALVATFHLQASTPEPLQNCLFDWISVQLGPFAADLALVAAF